jgi:predicted permease
VLLAPLPYREAERLVHVSAHYPIAPLSDLPFSDVGYRALERRTPSFEMTAAYRLAGVNLTIRQTPQRVLSARVSGNFFDLLGVRPQAGRYFRPGEESENGPNLIVLSDALWRGSFGADPSVVGSAVRVDGAPATIVGIAGARVAYPAANVGFFTLLSLDHVGTAPFSLGLDVIARLRPGLSTAAVAKDASRVIQEVSRENPGPHATRDSDFSGYLAIVRPLRDDMAGGVKPTLALLSTAVLFVLCLTWVNVATLELVRSSARRTELAVRSALGAARRRLIAGALLEGAFKASAGAVLGLALSFVLVRVLQQLLPSAFGAAAGGDTTGGILLATLVMIVSCTAASGVFPISATLGGDVQAALRDRAASGTRRLAWLRRGLIVTQLACACILVYGAATMIVAVRQAQRVVLGFRPDGLVVFNLSLPRDLYPQGSDVATAYRALVDELRSIPGVSHVGLATNVPLDAEHDESMVGVEGRPFKADGTDPNVDQRVVSPGYFEAMGIQLLAGRGFREGDTYLDGTPVVISRSMATLVWPDGSDPLGHRIRTGPYAPWMEIVGVVADAKNRSLTQPSRAELYLPFGAPRSPVGVSREMTFVVRASGSLESVQSAARRAVLRSNPDLPIYGLRRFKDVVDQSQVREVTTMRTLTVFACVALLMAVAGCYAMLMFNVMQRHGELAVRKAVGATGSDLVKMITREMASLLLVGITTGMLGALIASRLLSRFLFEVSPLDLRVTTGTLVVITLAGLGAALIPARKAGAVDLMRVLRAE